MKRTQPMSLFLVLTGIGLATVFAAGFTKPTPVQQLLPSCRSADGISWNLREGVIGAMTQTGSAEDVVISWLGLVRVPASQVAAVSDTLTCRRAAEAYSGALALPDSDRQVHVIRAGIRYMVIDPTLKGGGRLAGVTFDSSFTQVYIVFAY
jgi:hypothetical protein